MIRAAIIGASGYSGAQLLRLLLSHGDVYVEKVFANASAGKRVDELYPFFSHITDLVYESFDPNSITTMDVVFTTLPSGEAMNIIPVLMGKVERIIDLGGDYRLPMVEVYERFYHRTHSSPHLLGAAVYGLPELNRDRIVTARLVANPGCYPTSAILALLPALRGNIILPTGIIIDSLSGVSGSGRVASMELNFVEVNENIRAYKIGVHQHLPEMESILSFACNRLVSVSFVPHLVPLTRGIYTTIHAKLIKPLNDKDLVQLYTEFYSDQPFIRIKNQIPQIADVAYTNFCDIALYVDQSRSQLTIISVLDNLMKGAAGQAVQNMNIMFQLPEVQGLLSKEKHYVP